ncbi:transposase [Streptomyces mirabilis]|uniref:transposase n=1 Tax=Streptomyces mirabilis TaxID=68239 RepID=UPI003678C261
MPVPQLATPRTSRPAALWLKQLGAYRGRKDEPKGFGWRDFRDLITRARTQLGGPIVLVWDNVRLHLTAGIRKFIDANAEWLTVFQLPTYAPDLNPQEGIWSLVKRDIGNLAAASTIRTWSTAASPASASPSTDQPSPSTQRRRWGSHPRKAPASGVGG